VFSGKVKPEDYNARWWALRKQYQGIVPPVERASTDFDPARSITCPATSPT